VPNARIAGSGNLSAILGSGFLIAIGLITPIGDIKQPSPCGAVRGYLSLLGLLPVAAVDNL
jgi:hypothetical protein